MNFPGRIQPQQVSPTPAAVTSTSQPAGMQNTSVPSAAFPTSQHLANMAQSANNDNKNTMTPSLVQHQIPQAAQNNNNHGMGGIPHQLIAAQHQNMNRLNIAHQPTFQQQPQPVLGAAKMNMFEQLQNAYKHQMVSLGGPASQHIPAQSSMAAGQQDILQKLQQANPASAHQTKPAVVPQQAKPLFNQSSTSISQQNIQLSPTKAVHPQMKTTAKLASPGSQLQGLQKLPPGSNIFPSMIQQNKTVPSTPQLLTQSSSAALASSAGSTQSAPHVRPAAAVTSALPQLVSTVSVTVTSAPVGIVNSPPKASEQPKEPVSTVPAPSKPVPKPSVEEKQTAPNQPTPSPEASSKPVVEKLPPLPAALVITPSPAPDKSPAAVAIASPTKAANLGPLVNRSTMRLATVTPARQKKPPPTNNKKPQAAPVVQSAPKALAVTPTTPSPVAPTPPVVKAVETPKPSVQKASPAPTTPKTPTASLPSSTPGTSSSKTKRSRVKVQPYQIPTPEIAFVTKLSAQTANSNGKSGNDDKLTIFYK